MPKTKKPLKSETPAMLVIRSNAEAAEAVGNHKAAHVHWKLLRKLKRMVGM